MENLRDTQDYSKYDDKILDIDEIDGTDVKINPDFYIHSALLKAQQALTMPNIQEAHARYRVFIEHIEVLCIAAKMLSKDYEKEIKEFEETKEYKEEKNETKKSALISNKKLGLLMKEVFSKKVATDTLKA